MLASWILGSMLAMAPSGVEPEPLPPPPPPSSSADPWVDVVAAHEVLERAQAARAEWDRSCKDTTYGLCGRFGRRSAEWRRARMLEQVTSEPRGPRCGTNDRAFLRRMANPGPRTVELHPRRSRSAARAQAELAWVLDRTAVLPTGDGEVRATLVRARAIALLLTTDADLERWLARWTLGSLDDLSPALEALEHEALRFEARYAELWGLDPEWSTAGIARAALVHQLAFDRVWTMDAPHRPGRRPATLTLEQIWVLEDLMWPWGIRVDTRSARLLQACSRAITTHKQVNAIARSCEIEGARRGLPELTPPVELVDLQPSTHARVVSIPVQLVPPEG